MVWLGLGSELGGFFGFFGEGWLGGEDGGRGGFWVGFWVGLGVGRGGEVV